MAKNDLTTGFTGTPTEPPTGVRKVAKAAGDVVKRETSAVAAAAADHPHTATGLVLTIGALAFAIGYIMGRSSIEDTRQGYWR
ncbi:hypothetical protein [Ensifer adhaerens]|uniref:hypothetical protein n=1 Tax=Ensifer canadensis TaxID=555315 RepID=UPI00046CDAD2